MHERGSAWTEHLPRNALVLFAMWVARNGSIASGCECDKAKWQDCSGRKAVVLPYQRGAVFSLSRNESRHGKSTMVCQSTGRIFLHTRVPSSGNQSARTFQLFGRRGASTRYCSKPGYEPRYGLAIVSMEQEHRARLDRLLQRLAAEWI